MRCDITKVKGGGNHDADDDGGSNMAAVLEINIQHTAVCSFPPNN